MSKILFCHRRSKNEIMQDIVTTYKSIHSAEMVPIKKLQGLKNSLFQLQCELGGDVVSYDQAKAWEAENK